MAIDPSLTAEINELLVACVREGVTQADATEQVLRLAEKQGVNFVPESVQRYVAQAYANHAPATTTPAAAMPADPLPPWDNIRSSNPRPLAPEVMHGLLRRGQIGVLGAKGKGTKTYLTLRQAIELCMGGEFLGAKCEACTVLFVDVEVGESELDHRVAWICNELGYNKQEVDARLTVWSLMDVVVQDANGEHAPNIDDILTSVLIRRGRFDVIFLDSAANFLPPGIDENSNSGVTLFFGKVRALCRATGGCCWLVHHFGKGPQGDRDGADMLRGASAWLDRPALAYVMRELFPPSGTPSDFLADGERAFEVECVAMRSFRWPDSVRLIWSWPTHRVDSDGVLSDWRPKTSKSIGGKASGVKRTQDATLKAAKCESAILAEMYHRGIGDEGLSATDAASLCGDALGMDTSLPLQSLKRYVESSDHLAVWQRSARRWNVVAVKLAPTENRPRLA